jgi:hypothetical protein
MAIDVPSQSSLKDAAKHGGINGTVLALGETFGRSLAGPGLGTALGGVASAAAMSGATRDTAALVAVERGMGELFTGMGGSGGSNGGGSRRRM